MRFFFYRSPFSRSIMQIIWSFVLTFLFFNEGYPFSSFAFSEDFAAIFILSGDVFEADFYEVACFFGVGGNSCREFFIGSCEKVGFKVYVD